MSNNLRRQNISLSLDELSKSFYDIAQSLESNNHNHHLNFDNFSPILGEDGHLFTQEEFEKVFHSFTLFVCVHVFSIKFKLTFFLINNQ